MAAYGNVRLYECKITEFVWELEWGFVKQAAIRVVFVWESSINIIPSVDFCDNMIDLHFLVFVLFLTRLTLSWRKTLNKMPDATSSCLRMPFLKCYQIIKKERYDLCIIYQYFVFYWNILSQFYLKNTK